MIICLSTVLVLSQYCDYLSYHSICFATVLWLFVISQYFLSQYCDYLYNHCICFVTVVIFCHITIFCLSQYCNYLSNYHRIHCTSLENLMLTIRVKMSFVLSWGHFQSPLVIHPDSEKEMTNVFNKASKYIKKILAIFDHICWVMFIHMSSYQVKPPSLSISIHCVCKQERL